MHDLHSGLTLCFLASLSTRELHKLEIEDLESIVHFSVYWIYSNAEINMWLWILFFFKNLMCVSSYKHSNMFSSPSNLNQLAVDSDTHTVYVGAVNTLYQLTEDLKLQHKAVIGPELDDKECTPPIHISYCPTAKQTDNYVKLLLLDKPKERVVVCGTLFRGLCALRSLTNISNELYYVKDKGEKCYVVTNDENLSTVGLITTVSDNRLMYVAKGNGQFDNGFVISIRLLDTTPGSDKVPFETISEALVYKQDRIRNHPRFLSVFETDEHVYFILSRLEQKPDGKNKTSIARLCKSDINFYSYIDIALECDGSTFNIAQSAYVTNPSEELARSMSDSGNYGDVTTHDKVLFVVFTKVDKGKPSKMSALCMFPLKIINDKMEKVRAKAYSGEKTTIYNPYGETKVTSSKDGELHEAF
ncbi:plexin-B2-like [Protopterus annectens]|uniref:plexin-B2-like n=1 Tax=Protopterus annectens TaxID=7888 RepID=UPI001CFC407E|nr:plexin-B2-like [Protopterus annectens]